MKKLMHQKFAFSWTCILMLLTGFIPCPHTASKVSSPGDRQRLRRLRTIWVAVTLLEKQFFFIRGDYETLLLGSEEVARQDDSWFLFCI